MVGTPVSGNEAPGNDFTTLYLAARILEKAGFDAESISKILKEVYEAEIEASKVEEWLNTVPEAIRMKQALVNFLQTLSKDKLWALRYVAGAIMGDGDQYGRLRVKDWLFIDVYAKALAVLTDDPNMRIYRTRDGRYYTKRFPVALHLRDGVWKVLAYLDHHDEIKHFLAGLLDAEGSLSPHIDEKYKGLGIQISFGNTNLELVKFVAKSLEKMGLKPHLLVKRQEPQIVAGKKLLVPRKPVYEIKARVPFSKIMDFTRVGFRCSREAKLFSFFILVKDLPPHLRYEAFIGSWKKVNGRWKPVSTFEFERLEPSRLSRRRRRKRTVRCPVCQRPATLEIREVVDEKNMALKIQIHHDGSDCMGEVVLTFERNGTSFVKCKKCGEPGSVYVTVHKKNGRNEPRYEYLVVRVKHNTHGKVRHCDIMSQRLDKKT